MRLKTESEFCAVWARTLVVAVFHDTPRANGDSKTIRRLPDDIGSEIPSPGLLLWVLRGYITCALKTKNDR